MKRIGVIITTFNIEYATEVLNGIYDYFKDKDVCVVISQTRLPHSTVGIYDYQYWSCVNLLSSKEIDALIIATGVYCSSMKQEVLEKELARFGHRPIISMAIPLNLPDCHTIMSNCKKSYKDIISHLKNEHGCKKIAFMSAASTQSKEAIERYQAFKEAMAANGLAFEQENYFDGSFTDFQAEEALRKVLKSKETLHFDALVCANDMMAVGCCRVFKELGISVPDDVRVIGFDDANFASYSDPRLSTINQNIYGQGYESARAALETVNGRRLDKIIYTDLEPKFRQSCGCIPPSNSESIYKDSELNTRQETDSKVTRLNQYMTDLDEKNRIITLLDILKTSNTLRQFYYNLKHVISCCTMTNMSINLLQVPAYLDSDEELSIPEQMNLCMYYDTAEEKGAFNPQTEFNPKETLFPEPLTASRPGIHILHPIFSGETYYGHLICRIDKNKLPDYSVYLKIIISGISTAIEYTNKLLETEQLSVKYTEIKDANSTLSKQSKTDELTGVLNRRGFFEFGQRTLDIVQEMEHAGIIFFADMDGLKKINDTYGHNAGDEAIKLMSKIFKEAFRSNDVIGRLGGDEFGIVAPGMVREHIPQLREKINALCIKESKKQKLPYTLSISIGYTSLETSSSLKHLMAQADAVLYEEKRQKHGRT